MKLFLLQKKSWNLKNPKTWMHPRTPWTTNSSSNSGKDKHLLLFVFGIFRL